MRARRASLTDREREALSAAACGKLLSSHIWKDAGKVGLFVSLPEEILTRELLARAWREEKEVYLPKINPLEKGLMDFYKCSSFSELRKGKFGLLEPDGRGEILEHADLLLAPGLAFDRRGNRLGYGGGYYDRYLAARPLSKKSCGGFAYAFQLLDFLSNEAHDYKMSFLCTEEGIIWSNA